MAELFRRTDSRHERRVRAEIKDCVPSGCCGCHSNGDGDGPATQRLYAALVIMLCRIVCQLNQAPATTTTAPPRSACMALVYCFLELNMLCDCGTCILYIGIGTLHGACMALVSVGAVLRV
jgi:hypothetical protein